MRTPEPPPYRPPGPVGPPAGTHQAYAPTPMPGHPAPAHTGPAHTGPIPTGPIHAGPGYPPPTHAGPAHAAPVHTAPSHAAPVHPAPGHPGPGYGPPGYPPGEPAYDHAYPPAPYGGPGYEPTPYDAATEVFDRGLLTDPYADASTGPIPTAADGGPHGGLPPQPGGYGSPMAGFGPPPTAVEPEPPEPPAGAWDPSDPSADDHEPLFSRLRRIRSHARKRPSRRWVVVVLVIALVGAAAGLRFWPGSPWYHGSTDEEPTVAPMPLQSVDVTADDLGVEGFLSWAYEDLRDGTVVGSANLAETTNAGPLLTAWFGADLLRRAAENGQEPAETELADIEAMIRDEDLAAADRVVAALNGTQDSLDRLRTMCHLTNLTPVADSWPDTEISAQDAARMGGCLADGRAAGAQWTPWLLNVMRQVRDSGGIREAFPPDARAMIAVANGVVLDEEDGQWRANCLAVSETWSLAVLRRFPASGDPNIDLANIDVICQRVAQELSSTG